MKMEKRNHQKKNFECVLKVCCVD